MSKFNLFSDNHIKIDVIQEKKEIQSLDLMSHNGMYETIIGANELNNIGTISMPVSLNYLNPNIRNGRHYAVYISETNFNNDNMEHYSFGVSGNSMLNGDLIVNGQATINGPSRVNGDQFINGNIEIRGELIVTDGIEILGRTITRDQLDRLIALVS